MMAISKAQLLREGLQCVWKRLLSSGLRSIFPSSARWVVIGSYYFLPSGLSFQAIKNGTKIIREGLLFTKFIRLCFIFWFSWNSVLAWIARSAYDTLASLCLLRGLGSSFKSKYFDHAEMACGVGWVLPLSFRGFREVAHKISSLV